MNHGGLGMERVLGSQDVPVWQGLTKDLQLVQGGFRLDKTGYSTGEILRAGSPVVFDEATRTATVLRTAVIQADAASNATTYRVQKGSTLNVGDYLASGAVGGKAYAITAIDTSNSAYDELTVGTTICNGRRSCLRINRNRRDRVGIAGNQRLPLRRNTSYSRGREPFGRNQRNRIRSPRTLFGCNRRSFESERRVHHLFTIKIRQ
jgi:hypothetical protein